MATRSHRAPRAALLPFRVGRLARRRLERLAQRDAAVSASGSSASGSSASGSRFDDDQVEPTTPTVQAIQARANTYARREEQRFFANIHRELTEHRILTKELDTDLATYEEKLDILPPAERDSIAEGHGPIFDELRRLERRIKRDHRRTDELSALIHSRFTAAQLRANRFYDHSDEKIAIYWGAFRRSGTAAVPPVDRAPVLRRSEWLTTKENNKLLELWQGRTDVQA